MNREAYLRAVSYPYTIPTRSYVVDDGRWRELDEAAAMPDVSGRRPILAAGSNQSPEQLIRKYEGRGLGRVYSERIRLKDFDLVYSAHIAVYGSIPATPFPSPGTQVTAFVNWLTPDQEGRMHETELPRGNYRFGCLAGVEVTLSSGRTLDRIHVYSSARGALVRDGAPIPLAAAEAVNRRWPEMSQIAVQELARDLTAPGTGIEAFVAAAINAPETRRTRTETLMAASLPFECEAFSTVEI